MYNKTRSRKSVVNNGLYWNIERLVTLRKKGAVCNILYSNFVRDYKHKNEEHSTLITRSFNIFEPQDPSLDKK